MIAEFVQKLLDIAKPEVHEIEDVHGIKTSHSTKPLHQIKAAAPEEAHGVSILTLAAFGDLVAAKLEEQDFPSDFLIHIQDEKTVALKARKSDQFGRRLVLVQAKPVDFQQFRFGQWIGQEEFIIGLASLFADTPDKQYVLSMAATLTNDQAMTSEDDGFSQKVSAKAGIRMKETVTIKPRVELAPYRTFPEIAQPVSSFVFRAKCDGQTPPMLMLVEADGGRWKIDAIAEIKKALGALGLDIPIIA